MRSDQKQILEEGGFTLVTKSKRNRRTNRCARKAPIAAEDPPEDNEAARNKLFGYAKILKDWGTPKYLRNLSFFSRLRNEKKDFSARDGFLGNFLRQLDTHLKDRGPPQLVVCLGVGRFSECPIARTQLAFLLAVKDYFSGS